MSFDSEILLSRLEALGKGRDKPRRFLVAFSGGIDSTVLLHALADSAESHRTPILAIHVDHGLHEGSELWAAHCRRIAAGLGVDFDCRAVEIDDRSGLGPEAAARKARYEVFSSVVAPGDWLLSAHHEDDQADTLLLNLMRASGLAGLAGIGPVQRFGDGLLVRPLLEVSSASIAAYAEKKQLRWIDDPSNLDTRFDRNFLRRKIIPALRERWPGATQQLARSAGLAGEASELLNDLAELDLARVADTTRADRLSVAGMRSLSDDRQRNVLRHAARRCGLAVPPASCLYQITRELIPARKDAQPQVGWPGGEVRRYRDKLYLLPDTATADNLIESTLSADGRWLDLGAGNGQMRLEPGVEGGIDRADVGDGLAVRFRRGGEVFCPAGRDGTRKLKKLLQEEGVVPWMRQRIPLLYAGDRLVAVGDLWVAADASRPEGFGVRWRNRPALH